MNESKVGGARLEEQETAAAAQVAAEETQGAAAAQDAAQDGAGEAQAAAGAAVELPDDTQRAENDAASVAATTAAEAVKAVERAASSVREAVTRTDAAEDKPAESAAPGQAREVETLRQELLATRAEAEAARMGIPAGRLPYALRMAELSGIDPMGKDSAQQVRAALDKVLSDVPELRGGGMGTGSAGHFARETTSGIEQARQAFRRGLNG